MRMNDAQMYARILASDGTYNGRFFTGVLTTGIYCLPSCPARKPKRENVRFFPSCEAARATGLRACKKCHPDDFARGADPVLESIETLVAEVRSAPQNFADARAIVHRSGFGATRVFELFHQHYHSTPADLLLRARLATAKEKLLDSRAGLLEIANAVGFESLSVFHEQFRRLNGLTPAAYRDLREGNTFELTLPEGFLLPYFRRALTRDIHSVNEKITGNDYACAIRIGDKAVRLELTLDEKTIIARLPSPAVSGLLPAVHAIVVGLLGLDQNAAAFARAARKLGFARLVAQREELRLSQTVSVFDGLMWAIIGQQINFPFACMLKRRLFELAGTPIGDGLIAAPTSEAVASLKPEQLIAAKFSRQKADYVISTAKLIVDGKFPLADLPTMSATRAERTLLAVRGLGPWSVNYLMMRALGFADCVPLGDTSVTSGLKLLLQLEERPDVDATKRLMAVFAPYRSLATAHLWQSQQPAP